MSASVVVTGLGAVTPLGHTVSDTWEALLAGRSGVRRVSCFDVSSFATQIAAEVRAFDPRDHFSRKEARRLDRFIQFALVAAREAVHDAGLSLGSEKGAPGGRAGVFVGSGFGGVTTVQEEMERFRRSERRRVSPFLIPMMISNMAAGRLAIALGCKGPSLATVTGCAAGADAIGLAAEAIRRGTADLMICGGSEAAITPLIVAGFDSMGVMSTHNEEPERAARPFDARRDGFVIGEGAGILVLERREHAQRRDARIYAEVVGYGATSGATHITAPAENGDGTARAMQRALAQADLSPAHVDYINAHGTGTLLNDHHETVAIKTVLGESAWYVPVSSTKSMMGHLVGAAGAVEAVVCVKALETGMIPPTINYEEPDPDCDLDYVPNRARDTELDVVLTNSMGFGGHNATLILRRWDS